MRPETLSIVWDSPTFWAITAANLLWAAVSFAAPALLWWHCRPRLADPRARRLLSAILGAAIASGIAALGRVVGVYVGGWSIYGVVSLGASVAYLVAAVWVVRDCWAIPVIPDCDLVEEARRRARDRREGRAVAGMLRALVEELEEGGRSDA